MRTNESLPPTMKVADYNEFAKRHYSEVEQNKRIAETISIIVQYCEKETTKDYVTFTNLWKYLDIDKDHMNSFFNQLSSTLIHGKFPQYTHNGEELIILW